MFEIFRKTVSAGLGAVSLTKEKAEKLVDELVEKGQIKKEEAKKFVNELVEKGEEERNTIRELVKKEMTRLKEDMGLVSREELEKIEKRLQELETKDDK